MSAKKQKDIITIGSNAQRIGKTTASGKGAGVVITRPQAASSASSANSAQPSAGGAGKTSGSSGTSGGSGNGGTSGGYGSTGYGSGGTSGGTSNGYDPLVAVRDYAVGSGYSGVVSWDGEKATLGGTAIEPAYVIDGTAYVPRSEADAAIRDMEERSGILGTDEIDRLWEDRYGGAQDDALDDVLGREPFSYDPEDDPVYDAYRRMYLREADDALMRILNANNTSITGASGAVLSEALAARDEYLDRMTDMIPELASDAYDRYEGETDRLLDTLGAVSDIGDEYYDRLYGRDRDAYQALTEAGELEREERQRIADNDREDGYAYYDHALDAQELARGDIELGYYGDTLAEELRNAALENTLAEQEIDRGNVDALYYRRMAEQALREAILGNDKTAAEIWGIYN